MILGVFCNIVSNTRSPVTSRPSTIVAIELNIVRAATSGGLWNTTSHGVVSVSVRCLKDFRLRSTLLTVAG